MITGATATLNAQDLLTVHDGGNTLTLQLQGSYTGDHFQVTRDTIGGTYVILSATNVAQRSAPADMLPREIAPDPQSDLPAPAPAAVPHHAVPLEPPFPPSHH